MVAHFADWLDEAHDIHFALRKRRFRRRADRPPDAARRWRADQVWPLLDDFFRGEMHRQTLVPGALEALGRIGEVADIVILTNLGDEAHGWRVEQLAGHGIRHEVVCNQGGKGVPARAIIERHGAVERGVRRRSCRSTMPRSPSMRPKSGGCTWSPSRGWRRPCRRRRACPCADRRLADRVRLDPRTDSERRMTKTILITGATAGHRRGRGAALRGRRLAGDRHRPPRATGCARWPTSSATPSCRSSSTCATATRSPSLAKLSPPWGDIDLLLNNAGLAPPMEPLQDAEQEPLEQRHRHQHHRPGRADPRAAAEADRAQGRDHQPVVGRRDLSLSRRRGLRRHQGVRPPILARPALRPRRHRRARDLDRAGHGRDRVHAGPHRRRPGGVATRSTPT